VHDHASAIDVADLQARELGAAHASGVEGHQNGAIEGSRRSIDELCYFFLTENGGQAIALLGIGSVGNTPGPLECLDVNRIEELSVFKPWVRDFVFIGPQNRKRLRLCCRSHELSFRGFGTRGVVV
jgi:hypothetical protein